MDENNTGNCLHTSNYPVYRCRGILTWFYHLVNGIAEALGGMYRHLLSLVSRVITDCICAGHTAW